MLVNFLPNKDKKTTTMFIDDQIAEDEVPYVPSKLVDHRGAYLFGIAEREGLVWPDFEFDLSITDVDKIKRDFIYRYDPIYVKEAIRDFKPFERKRKKA